MDTPSWIQVGYIIKKKGLKGHVAIHFEIPVPETGKALFIAQKNRPLPFFIEHISGTETGTLVKFEEINTPEEAAKISQKAVYLPLSEYQKIPKTEKTIKKSVIGYWVIHEGHNIGTVKAVNDYAPNPLLIVACKHKEIMIPFHNHFVQSIHADKKEITVTLPDGLLAL